MVALCVASVLVGLAAGRICGGRPSGLLRLRLRAVWLLWAAVALQIGQFHVPSLRRWLEDDLGIPMLFLIYLGVGTWLLVNLPGRTRAIQFAIVVLLIGGTMNGAAILANGRMPFSVAAARRVDLPVTGLAPGDLPKHELATDGTRLRPLTDTIPVPLVNTIISPGDVVIICGIGALIAVGMRSGQAVGTRPDGLRGRSRGGHHHEPV